MAHRRLLQRPPLESDAVAARAGETRVGGGIPPARGRARERPARYRALLAQVDGHLGRAAPADRIGVHARRAGVGVPARRRLGPARRSPSCRRRRTDPAGSQPRDRRCVPPLRARRARLRALSTAPTPTPPARRERRPSKRARRRRALIVDDRARRRLRRGPRARPGAGRQPALRGHTDLGANVEAAGAAAGPRDGDRDRQALGNCIFG